MKTDSKNPPARRKRVLIFMEKIPLSERDYVRGVFRYCKARRNDWALDMRTRSVTGTPVDADLSGRYFDGVICNELALAPRVRSLAIPAVIVYGGIDRLNLPKRVSWHAELFLDNYALAEHALNHLLARGFTSFAYVGYAVERVWSQERALALNSLAARHGCRLKIYPKVSAAAARDFSLETRALAAWLRALPPKTAVIAANDTRAKQVLDVCRLAGIAVPAKLAVMGFDNDAERCEAAAPTLTSVAIGFEDAGFRAAELLDQYFRDTIPPVTESYASPSVVTRESTDERLTSDALVRRALERINAANGCHITVASLAAELHASVGSLFGHFTSALGHSPSIEINRVRLAFLKTLLRDPSLTCADIAARCGFSSNSHLSSFFRLHTGQTITTYRNTTI